MLDSKLEIKRELCVLQVLHTSYVSRPYNVLYRSVAANSDGEERIYLATIVLSWNVTSYRAHIFHAMYLLHMYIHNLYLGVSAKQYT